MRRQKTMRGVLSRPANRHPEIERAARPIGLAFGSPVAGLAGGDETAAARLTSAIVATAHGHAVLMLDGTFAPVTTPPGPPLNKQRQRGSP